MDLISVREIRVPTTRDEIVFAPGEQPLGGGTWLFSEPQPGLTGLVDLTALGWEPLTLDEATLTIAATCTIRDLTRLAAQPDWLAHPLVLQCANSLLASFKIWNVATVGGNVATALPAGAMISLLASLDAVAVIWGPRHTERRMPVATFVEDVRSTALRTGEVLRALEVPLSSLRSQAGFRRISLAELGRSGSLVIGRIDPNGEHVFTVTAATRHPVQLRFDELPSEASLVHAVDGIDCWYDDPHGPPDWRRAMTRRFAAELRDELATNRRETRA